jgi:hypothetical protein
MWSSPYSMLWFALSTRWAKGSVTILTAEPHGQPVMEGPIVPTRTPGSPLSACGVRMPISARRGRHPRIEISGQRDAPCDWSGCRGWLADQVGASLEATVRSIGSSSPSMTQRAKSHCLTRSASRSSRSAIRCVRVRGSCARRSEQLSRCCNTS